jgi:prolipoprotein diacylglyceryl transferase
MKPHLFSIPSPPAAWAQFQIGPLTVHTYALCILAGIVAAVLITGHRLRRRGAPGGLAVDAAIWAVPIGIVVARIYHVITHPGDYFAAGDDLWNVFAIWDGGNAIYGAEIGGAVGLWIACRRAGVRFLSFADALAPALLVAQAIGRLGNWFNHELFGLPTTLPWGLQIEASNPKFPAGLPAGTLFSPLFLYEIVWDLLGALVIVLLERRMALRWGRAIAVYFIWYGVGRAYLESIRIDPTSGGLLGVPDNEWASFVLIVLGVVLFAVQVQRHPGSEPDVRRDAHPGVERDGVAVLDGQPGIATPDVPNDSGSAADARR